MPHSSGGGSHGGGGHSGSSSGGGGGSYNNHHFTHSYFHGARAFVYYRHGAPVYIYSDKDLHNARHDKSRFIALIALIPVLAFLIFFICQYCLPPKAITGTDDYSIVIQDNANVFGDTTQLNNALQEFKDTTGITPAIITVKNSDWVSHYSSLENYAYDLYVNYMPDETCWLIVYSTDGASIGFEDWYWEGMQGNDTDSILSSSKLDSFNDNVQNYLTARTKYSVEEAFAKAFAELNGTVMEASVDYTAIIFFVIVGIILLGVIFSVIFPDLARGYKASELSEIKSSDESAKATPRTATCEYCGGAYVIGAHLNCPHCGASLPSDMSTYSQTTSSTKNIY